MYDLCVRVPERVNLPSAARQLHLAEVLHEELVPPGRLIDHGHPQGRGLVVHAPPAVDELEAALVHQSAGRVPALVVDLVPPAREEADLYVPALQSQTPST